MIDWKDYIESLKRKGKREVSVEELVNETDFPLEEFQEKPDDFLNEIDIFFADFHDFFPSLRRRAELSPEMINRVVEVEGILAGMSPPAFFPKCGVWQCKRCGEEIFKEHEFGKIEPPALCTNPACVRKGPFELILSLSTLYKFQWITIQEMPENSLGDVLCKAVLFKDHVDSVFPGKHIRLLGVLRCMPRKNSFSYYAETIGVELIDAYEPGEVDIEEMARFFDDDKNFNVIAEKIAPHIAGLSEVKRSILLSLFGGVREKHRRGDIHVLMVGDPSTAKSSILSWLTREMPNAVYSTGRGSSLAGLTASVLKEGDSYSLYAGAMVIADDGILCLDEIEKMNKEDREQIHTAMEQQFVAIHKAKFNVRLRSRCAVIAAGNPSEGRFDKHRPLAEQIKLDPAIISRFDFIWFLEDKPEEERDEKIAEAILSSRDDDFRVYVPYILKARSLQPKLSEKAKLKLKSIYLQLRKANIGDELGRIPITPRFLQAMLRASEARAKSRFSETVEVRDVEYAFSLFKQMLKQFKEIEGVLDADAIELGKSKKERLVEKLAKFVANYYEKEGRECPIEVAKDFLLQFTDVRCVTRVINDAVGKGLVQEERGCLYPTHNSFRKEK